jgi:hypothetical protein
MDITAADKMLRELQLIEFLFKLQLSDEYDTHPWLTVINGKREHIPGRFIGSSFMIYSEVELFNVQKFKQIFTDRFENSNNQTLIVNQSKAILKKAVSILKYITKNWNENNYKVKEFIEWKNKNEIDQQEWMKLKSEGRDNEFDWAKVRSDEHKHSAGVFIFNDLSINGVVYDRFMEPQAFSHSFDKYEYQYLQSNKIMKEVLYSVISFIKMLLAKKRSNSRIIRTLIFLLLAIGLCVVIYFVFGVNVWSVIITALGFIATIVFGLLTLPTHRS